jgi:uncharacterized membrane protein HdeD (DUF308 family)
VPDRVLVPRARLQERVQIACAGPFAKAEFDLWWLQLVIGTVEILLAFWVAGSFKRSVTLLVIYVGVLALAGGISELFVAFKLKGIQNRLKPA